MAEKDSVIPPAINLQLPLIYISKKDNQLQAFAGEELIYSVPVATGRNGCTPTGTF